MMTDNKTWFTVTVAFDTTDLERDAIVFNTNNYSNIVSLVDLVGNGYAVRDSDGHVYRFNKDKILFVDVFDSTEFLAED